MEKRAKQLEHEQEVSRLRAKCFTDKYMNNWTFENDNSVNLKMQKAKDYVLAWKKNELENCGLLLWGGVGTGKSYMAGCIANALLEQEVSVQMTNFAAILNELNSHYADRNEYIQRLCRNRLLIIDDLGMERGTDYGLEQVYNVIDAKYRSHKPLIITTNLTLNEMQNETNIARKRIYDRVLEMCIPMQIQGTHMRKIERENKFRKFTEDEKWRKGELLMFEVPIWEKYALSIEEVADYFGIGQKKIRKIVDENPTAEFILKNGAFTKIKRGKFEWFLDRTSCI